jgi:hypothetical protein
MHRWGVRNVNSASVRALVLTFGTHTVRNVNGALARGSRLTKCTGRPAFPSMPQLTFARYAGTAARSSTAMNARDHSGMSGQPRHETMLPSTTSGASTNVAPAFSMSPCSGG